MSSRAHSRSHNIYVCVYICICVTSKTISVTEDVYELLSKMKLKGESFSDTIRRLSRRRSLADCAGLWSEVSEGEMDAFWESVRELRKRTGESLRDQTLEGC